MSSLTVRVPGHDYDPYEQNMLVSGHRNSPCGQLNTSTMLGRALILTHPLGIKNNVFELPTFTFIHTPYWHFIVCTKSVNYGNCLKVTTCTPNHWTLTKGWTNNPVASLGPTLGKTMPPMEKCTLMGMNDKSKKIA